MNKSDFDKVKQGLIREAESVPFEMVKGEETIVSSSEMNINKTIKKKKQNSFDKDKVYKNRSEYEKEKREKLGGDVDKMLNDIIEHNKLKNGQNSTNQETSEEEKQSEGIDEDEKFQKEQQEIADRRTSEINTFIEEELKRREQTDNDNESFDLYQVDTDENSDNTPQNINPKQPEPKTPEPEKITSKSENPEPEKTKPESGNPKPAETTPEPTKPTVTKTPENNTEELEKNLDEARAAYIEEYKKCAKEANRHKLIEQTKNSILNIFKKRDSKATINTEDFFTDKLKESERKYKESKVSIQNKMHLDKKAELEKTLSGEELLKALSLYRTTEILKFFENEKQKIIDAKTEKIATWKKIIDGYRKLPKYQRVALSTALFTAAAGTGIIGGGALAGYGLVGMATMKFAKSMAIGSFVGHATKSVDWLNKRNDKIFEMKQNIHKTNLKEKYGKGEISLENYENEIDLLSKEEKKRYRNRALLKAGVGVALAGFSGYLAYDMLGNGISHIESVAHDGSGNVDAISGPDAGHIHDTIDHTKIPVENIPKNIIEHGDVRAVADHGQGAISTLKELQNNLRAEYGNNLDNAPVSVKHILETDAHKLAEEYGMYKPGQDAESAFVKSGSYFEVDKDGNLTYHAIGDKNDGLILEKGTELKGSGVYDEKMVDTDHSHESQIEETPHVTDSDTNTLPEQIDPETGEKIDISKIQETPKVSDTNANIINEQVNPENGGKLAGQDNTDIVRDGLTRAEIEHAHNVFNNNIDHLIGSQPRSAWQYIQNNVSAQRIMEMHRVGEVKEDFIRLTDHMDKLERITGVHPQGPEYGLGGIILKEAETIPHFIGRALEEAEKQGVIDQVTL